MALSKELVSQFAKLANDKKEPNEATVTGVYKSFGGKDYVQLDGSDIWTPVDATVSAEDGDRVKVLVKEHAATMMGNITSPSARSKDVNTLKDEVDEFGNTIHQMDNTITQQGNSIIQIDNIINQHENTINQHGNAINQQNNVIVQMDNVIQQHGNEIIQQNNKINQNSDNITSMNNTINQQSNNIVSMNNTINQQGNQINQQSNIITQQGNIITQQGNTITQINDNITSMNNTINQQGNDIYQIDNVVNQQGNIISQQGNTILQQGNRIEEHNANITILNSGFTIIDGHLTGLSSAVIDDLKTNTLNAEYAEIDFANVNVTNIGKLFSKSGIIHDLTVGDEQITGELVGVTINGDLIQGNTLRADKLVIKGSDGLYYKLNIDGLNNISTTQAAKFDLTEEEPQDWETNWKKYYIIDTSGQDDEFVHLTGDSAPTWIVDTYYQLAPEYGSGLDGSNIVAKTITAEKVAVTDLVAFEATIGGFEIEENSIHNIGKGTIDSPTNGIYMDSEGQMCIGGGSNTEQHIKYYKDANNRYLLDVRLNKLYIGANEEDAEGMFKSWLELSAKGIVTKFTATGGLNLLQNSVGFNGTQWWSIHKSGDASVVSEPLPEISQSGYGFKLSGVCSMEQQYETVVDDVQIVTDATGDEPEQEDPKNITNVYSVAFKYKHDIKSGGGSSCKVEIIGSSTTITILNSTTEQNDWETIIYKYKAQSSHPHIKISCSGDDVFEITDLIVSKGDNEAWSPYYAETLGASYGLDKNGLYISDYEHQSDKNKDNIFLSKNSLLFKQGNDLKTEISQNRVYANKGIFNDEYTVGHVNVRGEYVLRTYRVDYCNVIESAEKIV